MQLSKCNVYILMGSNITRLKITRDAFGGRGFNSNNKTATKLWIFLKCSIWVSSVYVFGSFACSCLHTQWKMRRSARVRKAFTQKDLRASGCKNCVKWCNQRSRSGCWSLTDCVTFFPLEQWNLRRCGLRVSLSAFLRVSVQKSPRTSWNVLF